MLKHLYQIIIRSYWGHLYYSLIDMPKKKKKMKFNYDTHMYKTHWPENPFSAGKMDLGGQNHNWLSAKRVENMLNIIGTF